MKVHRIVLTVVDFDGLGPDGVISALENARYPNRCINPSIQIIETRDIGEWHDGHPLNRTDTEAAEIERLFSQPAA